MVLASFSQYFFLALTGLLTYATIKVGVFIVKMRRIGKAVDRFPSNPKHWLWGHIHEFPGPTEERLRYFDSLVKKYPRACAFWVSSFLRPSVMVYHPDTVKVILKTSEPKPLNQGLYKYLIEWVGISLVIITGAKWTRNRKLLTPVFHFDILKEYLKIGNQAVEIFLSKLAKHAKSGDSIDVFDNISMLTLDVIMRCAFSYENDVQIRGGVHPYLTAVVELLKLLFKRCFRPWEHFNFIYYLTSDGKAFKKYATYVHQFAEKIIHDKKEIIKKNPDYKPPYQDFLDILMLAKDEDGLGLTEKEIRDEVDTFLFAGHDTTAITTSWVLACLAEHPQYQRICQKEVDDLPEFRSEDVIQWDDLHKLPYLTMCIHETMRLHTTVPLIDRQLDKPLMVDGVELPEGTIITINLYNLHHNPAVWSDPMKFDPERFSEANVSKMDPYAFVPFSAGPRNCIGMKFAMDEIKMVVARVLKKFNLSLDPARKMEIEMATVMKVKNGMYLKVSKR